jgi:hypothetical protein
VDFDDQSYYGYHKLYKEVTIDDSIAYLQEFFGEKILVEIKNQIQEFLIKFLSQNKNCIVISPWGIGHPFHLFIRNVLDNNIINNVLWYYREFPHSYKRRSKTQVEKQQAICKLIYSFPVIKFDDIKWLLAKKFYKSQSGLLFFEQGYIKKQLPEEIYVKQ